MTSSPRGTVVVPCRYLCSTACGAEVLHMYGGLVPQPQHTTVDGAQGNEKLPALFAVRPIGGAVERTSLSSVAASSPVEPPPPSSSPSTVLALDGVALMDHVLRYRLVNAVAFATAATVSPSSQWGTYCDDDGGGAPSRFDRLVRCVTSPQHRELLASLSIDGDLLDVSLSPSVSGTREERLEGLRRVLPLLSTDLPVLQEADVIGMPAEANDASATTLLVTTLRFPASASCFDGGNDAVQPFDSAPTTRRQQLEDDELDLYPLDVGVYDVHAHLEDMHAHMLQQVQ